MLACSKKLHTRKIVKNTDILRKNSKLVLSRQISIGPTDDILSQIITISRFKEQLQQVAPREVRTKGFSGYPKR